MNENDTLKVTQYVLNTYKKEDDIRRNVSRQFHRTKHVWNDLPWIRGFSFLKRSFLEELWFADKDKEAGLSKPSSKVEEGKGPLKAAATPMEPPRVPPVSEHFVQVANTVSEAAASNEVTKILSTGILIKDDLIPFSNIEILLFWLVLVCFIN